MFCLNIHITRLLRSIFWRSKLLNFAEKSQMVDRCIIQKMEDHKKKQLVNDWFALIHVRTCVINVAGKEWFVMIHPNPNHRSYWVDLGSEMYSYELFWEWTKIWPRPKLSTIHDSSFWGCFLGEWLTCKIRFQANNGEDMHPMTQCRWGGCHDDRLLAVPPPHDILPEIIHDIHVVTMLWVLLESSQEMGLVHRAQDISESVPQKYSSIVVIKIQRFDEFYPTCSSMFMAKIQRFLSPRVLCHEESWGS